VDKKSTEENELVGVVVSIFDFNASSLPEETLRVSILLGVEAEMVREIMISERNRRILKLKSDTKIFFKNMKGSW